MRTALVCVAKNEDHYIDEWLEYHFLLGFSKAFVYMNDWDYDLSKYGDKVVVRKTTGVRQQLPSYNQFLADDFKNFDYAAFLDVDEFLYMEGRMSDWLASHTDIPIIKLKWKLFGSNGHERVEDGNYSVINRFTKSQRGFGFWCKLILNRALLPEDIHFTINPHNCSVASTLTTDAWIGHFRCKTLEEFLVRKASTFGGHSVCKGFCKNEGMKKSMYKNHDRNEVENTCLVAKLEDMRKEASGI